MTAATSSSGSRRTSDVGSGWGIYQQRYDADGNKVGVELRVNGVTTGAQLDPDVTALDDGGGWVVSWTSDQSGTPEIYQRRYTPTGLSLSQSEVTEKGDPFVGFLPADDGGRGEHRLVSRRQRRRALQDHSGHATSSSSPTPPPSTATRARTPTRSP